VSDEVGRINSRRDTNLRIMNDSDLSQFTQQGASSCNTEFTDRIIADYKRPVRIIMITLRCCTTIKVQA
jgi:hypothetical protein